MRVSVVIPTWNRRGLLVECLRSLDGQKFRSFEVVVVDDGSTDDTVEVVERDFPAVCLVRLPVNRGFCVAINAGIREARGDLLFLLNNDMILDPNCLKKLEETAQQSEAGMFAPLVLWRDEPEIIYSAGDLQRASGRPESVGFRRALSTFEFPQNIFGVSAGAALYKRAVFEKVGLFDESFGAYFEDSDLSFRARLAGFQAEFVRDAVAYHSGSASLEGRHRWRAQQCCRNHLLLVLKNMPAPLLFRHAPAIIAERLHQIRRVLSVAYSENGPFAAISAIIGTLASTAVRVPHALRERGRIRRMRTLSVDELDSLLTTTGQDRRSDQTTPDEAG